MKPLIIMANGKSMGDVDLKQLEDQDTIGLNNAYSHYESINWFPKYFGIFDMQSSKIDAKKAGKFILNHHRKLDKIFYYGSQINEELLSLRKDITNIFDDTRLQYVDLTLVKKLKLKINLNKYALPLQIEISSARNMISDEKEQNYFDVFIEFLNKKEVEEIEPLNNVGILKKYRKESLDSTCYINNPRFSMEWNLPTSFEDFNFLGGPSIIISAYIGYLLGYDKIILLGVDNKWETKDDVLDTKNTYWIEDYFPEPYNVKDYCDICTPENIQEMQIYECKILIDTLKAYDINMDIVNCTPDSALEGFRTSTLDKEL